MITVDDIRNPNAVSGYRHVSIGIDPVRPATKRKPFQAQSNAGGKRWMGPRRATAEEAAQDYCDYVSGQPPIRPSDPRGRAGVKRAGHSYTTTKVPEIPSDIEAAYGMIRDFRAQQAGKQGYVYLIIEDNEGGALTYGKIGFSTNPARRLVEVQTGNPRKLRLYASKPGTLGDERTLHERHLDKNILQEWFHLDASLLLEWGADEIVYEEEDA